MTESALAETVCARICHDLSSPVGALVNGIDLIREITPEGGAGELGMIIQTADRAAALLKFHRLAFGAVADPAASLRRTELRERIETATSSPRVSLGWSALEGPPVTLPVARLTCLLVLAARRCLGLAGALKVVLPARDTLPVSVIAEGDRASISADQRRWLASDHDRPPDSREVEFALLPPAARAAGARIVLSEGERQIALRAVGI